MITFILIICLLLISLLSYLVYDLYGRLEMLTDKFEQLQETTGNIVASEIKITENQAKSLVSLSDALINHLRQHNNCSEVTVNVSDLYD